MKRILIIIIQLEFILINFTIAQNLVINPGFEAYDSLSCINRDSLPLKGWFKPYNHCTPDYYNIKKQIGRFKAPNTICGFQMPNNGNGFLGLGLFSWMGTMEHISGMLKEPLQSGKKYMISFYVSYSRSRLYSKKISVKLSLNKYVFFNHEDIFPSYNELFYNKTNKIVADIVFTIDTSYRWEKYQGEYVAKGGEKYFTIGMFYDEIFSWDNTINLINDYLKINMDTAKESKFFRKHHDTPILSTNDNYDKSCLIRTPHCAYYFIDDVSIEPIEEKKIP